MKELWKDIQGYEYKYQISNFGAVKIKENVSERMNMGELRNYIQKSKIMKPTENGKASNLYIHRLVAIHFIENLHNKPQVNHKDGNIKNKNNNNN